MINQEILDKEINGASSDMNEMDFNPKESNLAHYMNKKSVH